MKKKKLKKHNIDAMVECEQCGKRVLRKDATFFDPWEEEINNVRIPVVLCDDCAWDIAADI